MATQHHTRVPYAALAALFFALAVGSAPLAAYVLLSNPVEVLK